MDGGKRGEERRLRKGGIVREEEDRWDTRGIVTENIKLNCYKKKKKMNKWIKTTSCFWFTYVRHCSDGQRKWQVPLPQTLCCQRGSRHFVLGINVSLTQTDPEKCKHTETFSGKKEDRCWAATEDYFYNLFICQLFDKMWEIDYLVWPTVWKICNNRKNTKRSWT